MKNSIAKNVIKKNFAHLDEILEEKKQDNLSMADMFTETEIHGSAWQIQQLRLLSNKDKH